MSELTKTIPPFLNITIVLIFQTVKKNISDYELLYYRIDEVN